MYSSTLLLVALPASSLEEEQDDESVELLDYLHYSGSGTVSLAAEMRPLPDFAAEIRPLPFLAALIRPWLTFLVEVATCMVGSSLKFFFI